MSVAASVLHGDIVIIDWLCVESTNTPAPFYLPTHSGFSAMSYKLSFYSSECAQPLMHKSNFFIDHQSGWLRSQT